ncbi:uncharacterized protein At1g04910-like isoform X2 [Chenopodium quinoa]|uniref:uncharacterized protein At1g04910-like isoform X2 n=1 Tax=Chenopodium quinoa TaxID=63459 RepID=UPI000B77BEF1|nr:uncharacterized protein At1g04910-like isoform X2 [Chenopodium quinoa]
MTEKDRRKGWEGRRAKNGREVHPVKIFAAIPHRFSNGYLLIAGITDVVAVVRILDATLVVSLLDHNSYWKDDSDFADIFYVDWFISSLAKDVKIVKKFPNKITRSMEKPPYTMRVPRKSNPEDYIELFAYGAYFVNY